VLENLFNLFFGEPPDPMYEQSYLLYNYFRYIVGTLLIVESFAIFKILAASMRGRR